MSKQPEIVHPSVELIHVLRSTRDEVRLHVHRFSMDARERWRTLEQQLVRMEIQLREGLERPAEVGAGAASTSVHELRARAQSLLFEHGIGAQERRPKSVAPASGPQY